MLSSTAQVEAAVGLQRPRQRVGLVADLPGRLHHLAAGQLADVRIAVEHLADRGNGQVAVARDILDGHRHGKFLPRFGASAVEPLF